MLWQEGCFAVVVDATTARAGRHKVAVLCTVLFDESG